MNDESCYQELYRLLRPWLSPTKSLAFIASGKDGHGNDTRVIDLVSNLREAGNTSVYGIVDRDGRKTAPDHVIYDKERYTIENVVLDPLIIGYVLLKQKLVKPQVLGLVPDFDHRDVPIHSQVVTDAIIRTLDPKDDGTDRVTCTYVGGTSVAVPRWYLDHDGHKLEERLRMAFPQLNAYKRHELKAKVIAFGFSDLPELVPDVLTRIFRTIEQ